MKYTIQVDGSEIIVRSDKKYWHTKIRSGVGSFEPWAAANLRLLLTSYDPAEVAQAISRLNVYPSKLDAEDMGSITTCLESAH